MGDKKQKEAMIKKVKQVLVVGACVLFVVLMILSGMGSHWLTMFTVVKPGDTVVVDYTFYDATGTPILTSNQQTIPGGSERKEYLLCKPAALDDCRPEPDQRRFILSRSIRAAAGGQISLPYSPRNMMQ